MSETAPETNARMRGRGFPTVPLAVAATTIRRIARHGALHSEAAFAQYLGHNTTNSGAFRQKTAAFRDWGLITSSGGRIALTDMARRLAMVDEGDDVDVLRDVFVGCGVFRSVYDECAKGQPIETSWLARHAVLTLGVAPASGDRFVESFVASAIAAGLARRVSERVFVLDSTAESLPDHPTAVPPALVQSSTTLFGGGGEHVPSARPPVVVRQEWPCGDAVVAFEIRSAAPLPPDVFRSIANAVTAVGAVADELRTKGGEGA